MPLHSLPKLKVELRVFSTFEGLQTFSLFTVYSDFVKVVDKVVGKLFVGCGHEDHFAVITPTSANVMLHSDTGIEKTGFNATYFTIDKNSKGK